MKHNFSANLKRLRKNAGFTQETFAQVSGLKRNTIALYETGKRECSFDSLILFSTILNCSIDELLKEPEDIIKKDEENLLGKNIKIINWNISWANDIIKKIEYLKTQILNERFIVILQEVKLHAYNALKEHLSDIAQIEYSLSYRIPGKYDTDSRKLGIAILISKDISLKNAEILDRSLMPDRTLMVDVVYDNMPLRILGLHSITGCQHLKAKEIQYFSFAEAVDTYKPDIVGIDANEPEIDHYDISQMKFFDNYQKGNGCKTFFETMRQNALVDAFVKNYDKSQFVEGEYLETSHIIKRGNKKVRYDFLFINSEKFNDYSCEYEYNGAVNAGSDHAAVVVNMLK